MFPSSNIVACCRARLFFRLLHQSPSSIPLSVDICSSNIVRAASDETNNIPRKVSPSYTYRNKLDEMLRVDHAGEYGAVRIYEGQLAALKYFPSGLLGSSKAPPVLAIDAIEKMALQEREHLNEFNQLLPTYRVRPSFLLPFWHVGGLTLGFTSALIGGKVGAMACTVAVEDAISEHYNEQVRELTTIIDQEQSSMVQTDLSAIKQTFVRFRDEEVEHKATAIEHEAQSAPGYQLIYQSIYWGCKLAVAIAKKV